MLLKKRCAWVPEDKVDYVYYHDHEWGVPVFDDKLLFEMLILEGAQAGLSWYTILKRRDGYRLAFKNFDILKCAEMTDLELENILSTANVIRNRLKIFSVRKNASVFLSIQQEFGSFYKYLERYKLTSSANKQEPSKVTSDESDALSKDLKKRGMSFVGSTIIYAFMQAVGIINDHNGDCFLAPKL